MERGGEGVILRAAKSLYEHGRSDSLLKLKASRADSEALVVTVNDDFSFELQLPNGDTFHTPPQNRSLFETLPQRGDVVTFSCETYSRKSIPVNAEISRIRKDVTWRDVIRDYVAERSRALQLNESLNKGYGLADNPPGRWTEKRMNHLKRMLLDISAKHKLDPKNSSTWYSLASNIMNVKEISHLVNKFKGGYPRLMMQLFSDIGLKGNEFPSYRNYWASVKNQRQLFINFAKANDFDPLVPDNWYSVSSESIKSFEGARAVLSSYGMGHVNALLHLFPEIGLKSSLFKTKPRGYWEDIENQRNFFITFARQKGLDPTQASNWQSIAADEIKQQPGASSLLGHFSGNVQKALLHVFPNIGLKAVTSNSLGSNHLEFLTNFAKERGFDPLIASNWYPIKSSHFANSKQGRVFLSSIQNDFKRALRDAFPETQFEDAMFHPGSLKEGSAQRHFLESFAQKNGFDPLVAKNWYSVSANQLRSKKGAEQLLSIYNGSLTQALLQNFPEIGLDKDKFPKSHKFWANENNQRELFLNFAIGRVFNPRDSSHWYKHIGDFVKSQKKSGSVLNYYNNSAEAALFHLFPDIGLDKGKLRL